jgi:hypothetical protein
MGRASDPCGSCGLNLCEIAGEGRPALKFANAPPRPVSLGCHPACRGGRVPVRRLPPYLALGGSPPLRVYRRSGAIPIFATPLLSLNHRHRHRLPAGLRRGRVLVWWGLERRARARRPSKRNRPPPVREISATGVGPTFPSARSPLAFEPSRQLVPLKTTFSTSPD